MDTKASPLKTKRDISYDKHPLKVFFRILHPLQRPQPETCGHQSGLMVISLKILIN